MRWRSKKERPLTPNQRQSRRDIRSQTATLVQVANRAEPLAQKLAEPEVTSESERLATQALIAAQTDLHAAINKGLSAELTLDWIIAKAIQPVLDGAVVSELAAFSIDHVIVCARARVAEATDTSR